MTKYESKGTWFETYALDDRQAFQASFAGSLTMACGCCGTRAADPERFQQRGIKRCDRCWRYCPLGGAHVARRGPQKWCAVCRGEGDFCQHCCLVDE